MLNLIQHTLFRVVTALFFILVIVAWMAGSFRNKIEPGSVENSLVAGLQPYVVEPTSTTVTETIPASIKAREETAISSRLLGQVERILVRAGDKVEQGDLLVSLDTQELEASLSQARAEQQALKARFNEARNNLERISELHQSGIASQSELESAEADVNSLTSQLAAATQNKQRAQAQLNYASLRAPIDGTIIDRLAEPGDMAQPGVPLLSLYNPQSLQVEARIRESVGVTLSEGQNVRVLVDSIGQTFDASIVEIVPAADPSSRVFVVKAGIQDTSSLRPGMYAKVIVNTGHEQKLFVPAHYIQTIGQLEMVWVETGTGVTRRYVRTGTKKDEKVEVVTGIKQGDTLVIID